MQDNKAKHRGGIMMRHVRKGCRGETVSTPLDIDQADRYCGDSISCQTRRDILNDSILYLLDRLITNMAFLDELDSLLHRAYVFT